MCGSKITRETHDFVAPSSVPIQERKCHQTLFQLAWVHTHILYRQCSHLPFLRIRTSPAHSGCEEGQQKPGRVLAKRMSRSLHIGRGCERRCEQQTCHQKTRVWVSRFCHLIAERVLSDAYYYYFLPIKHISIFLLTYGLLR